MKNRKSLVSVLVGTLVLSAFGSISEANSLTYFGGGCIGGAICGRTKTLKIPMPGMELVKIRFRAHDKVGDRYEGKLHIYVNDRRIVDSLDIKKNAQDYTIMVNELNVFSVEFYPATNDEVMIKWVELETAGM